MPDTEHEGITELVTAGDVELFVRRFGDPRLPMLIVVHGGPTWDHSYLVPAVAGLADLAHVVLFDLRGCGRSSRTPPVGQLPFTALQPDLVADDVAALIRHYGAARADVLGFSYGGGVAMRFVDQHPGMIRRLILASTSAYRDHEWARETSADYQARAPLCADIAWDDPVLAGPNAPDGALSKAMAYAGAPFDIWQLDRLEDWHRMLARVRFSSDWNAPHTAGQLRPAMPQCRAEELGEASPDLARQPGDVVPGQSRQKAAYSAPRQHTGGDPRRGAHGPLRQRPSVAGSHPKLPQHSAMTVLTLVMCTSRKPVDHPQRAGFR